MEGGLAQNKEFSQGWDFIPLRQTLLCKRQSRGPILLKSTFPLMLCKQKTNFSLSGEMGPFLFFSGAVRSEKEVGRFCHPVAPTEEASLGRLADQSPLQANNLG